MGKIIDLTGRRFGRLVVIERTNEKAGRNYKWLCLCDCGTYKTIRGSGLTHGEALSCGCLHGDVMRATNTIDIVGMRFERLLVVGKQIINNKTTWICQCDCGNTIYSTTGRLKTGNTKSCGCLKRGVISKKHTVDLTGMRFGRLYVVSRSDKKNKNQRVEWKCVCDCGSIVSINSKYLISGDTKSCGCLSESWIASELKKYFLKNHGAKLEYKELINPHTGKYLPYDIYIPHGIYIEVQGIQHYEKNHFKQSKDDFSESIVRDYLKKQHAEQNGIFIAIDLREERTVEEWIRYIEEIICQ